MRQLGTIADEQAARRFADYLLTKGIDASIDRSPEGARIWVRDEDHLQDARREFAEFSQSPDAPAYRDAARAADQLRAREQARAQQAHKNFVDVSRRWRSHPAGRALVTSLLVAISIGVAFLTNLGGNERKYYFFIDYRVVTPDGPMLAGAWREEPWRIVTPIFLHLNLLHILFNMMWLMQLGPIIEMHRGSLRFLLLVLVIAVTSNVGQLLWTHNPYFGGMSGVVYGLFGYIWMKSRYEPRSGFVMTQSTVIMMIGWFVLCLIGPLPIANGAHGVGLLVGMIAGRWRSVWSLLR